MRFFRFPSAELCLLLCIAEGQIDNVSADASNYSAADAEADPTSIRLLCMKPVSAICFSALGDVLATAAANRTDLWNVRTGRRIGHVNDDTHSNGNYSIEFLAFGDPDKHLITARPSAAPVSWDTKSGLQRSINVWAPSFHPAVSPDGKQFVTWDSWRGLSARGIIEVISSLTGDRLKVLQTPRGIIDRVTYSHDGRLLAVAHTSQPGGLIIYDVASTDELYRLDGTGAAAAILGCRWIGFSPSGDFVAAVLADGNLVRCWQTSSRKPVFNEMLPSAANSAAWGRTGRTIALALESGDVQMWELMSRQKRLQIHAHEYGTTQVAMSPDERMLATGSRDKTCLLWHLLAAVSPSPSKTMFEKWWDDLGVEDGVTSYKAIRCLASSGGGALFVRTKLEATYSIDQDRVARLLESLGDDSFVVREKAQRGLEVLGDAVTPVVTRALQRCHNADTRRRLKEVLVACRDISTPNLRRVYRAIEVLELSQDLSALESLSQMEHILNSMLFVEAKAAYNRTRELKSNIPRAEESR